MQAISLNSASNSISCTAFYNRHAPATCPVPMHPLSHLPQFSELKFTSILLPSIARYNKLIGGLVCSFRIDLLCHSKLLRRTTSGNRECRVTDIGPADGTYIGPVVQYLSQAVRYRFRSLCKGKLLNYSLYFTTIPSISNYLHLCFKC